MIGSELIAVLAPEIVLATFATLVLMLGIAKSSGLRAVSGPLSIIGVLAALVFTWSNWSTVRLGVADQVLITSLTTYVRITALTVGLIVLLLHSRVAQSAEQPEVFSMILFSLTGIMLTSVADDLILLFLAIELVSVPTYVLVSAGRSDIRAQEAGVKYFFLGAMAAALLAYGFSFLYGVSGTTQLSAMNFAGGLDGYVTWGLLLAFMGVAFKIAAVPFHVYAADVYHGAASPVTGLLGFFPKFAGFIALIKLMILTQPVGGAIMAGWQLPAPAFWFLWIVAAATMTIGNVLGLLQHNVKRMLAYSSVAHSGYMLIALLVGPVADGGPMRNGVSAMLFYIVAYAVMNLGAFGVLSLLQANGKEAEELDDLSGLARKAPLAALAMAICCFSLMGMPPTAGFFGKVYVFSSALSTTAAHPHHTAMMVLAIIGVLNSAIAAAYYLRIIAACYLGDAKRELTIPASSTSVQLGVSVCCGIVLALGLYPVGLLNMSAAAQHDLLAPPPAPPAVATESVEPAADLLTDSTHSSPVSQH